MQTYDIVAEVYDNYFDDDTIYSPLEVIPLPPVKRRRVRNSTLAIRKYLSLCSSPGQSVTHHSNVDEYFELPDNRDRSDSTDTLVNAEGYESFLTISSSLSGIQFNRYLTIEGSRIDIYTDQEKVEKLESFEISFTTCTNEIGEYGLTVFNNEKTLHISADDHEVYQRWYGLIRTRIERERHENDSLIKARLESFEEADSLQESDPTGIISEQLSNIEIKVSSCCDGGGELKKSKKGLGTALKGFFFNTVSSREQLKC